MPGNPIARENHAPMRGLLQGKGGASSFESR
jgi:hypothetical protein